jgi:phage antirepressor YoqD-like protein
MNYIEKYNLSEAAREINIPNMGRTKIYKVLRELGIVDEDNCPANEYVKSGYLAVESPTRYVNGWIKQVPVTLVVGNRGLQFLRQVIEDYLKTHSVPKIQREKKYYSGTSI